MGCQKDEKTVIVEHIKKRKSINAKIVDKMRDRTRLREEFRVAQKEYQQACGTPDRCRREATSMMAVTKKLVTAEDKREGEPVIPPPWPARPETVSMEHEDCQEARNLASCPCEGFKKCIGRKDIDNSPTGAVSDKKIVQVQRTLMWRRRCPVQDF